MNRTDLAVITSKVTKQPRSAEHRVMWGLMGQIVIDTNVFVAAGFNLRSAAARILAAVREGRFQLIWNEPTRRETELILRRIPHLAWERLLIFSSPRGSLLAPSILRASSSSRIQRIGNSRR